MNRKLFVPILFCILVGALAFDGCTKKTDMAQRDSIIGGNPPPPAQPDSSFYFYSGNHPAAEFSFLKSQLNGMPVDTASPNGNTAWLGFGSITNPAPATSQTVTWTQPTSVDSFTILYAPATSMAAPFPTSSVVTNSGTVSLPAGARSILVPLYKKLSVGTKWTPFDSVSYTPYSPNLTTYYGNSPGAQQGTVTANFKSTDGTKTASVIIIITSTTETPWMPPGHKK